MYRLHDCLRNIKFLLIKTKDIKSKNKNIKSKKTKTIDKLTQELDSYHFMQKQGINYDKNIQITSKTDSFSIPGAHVP
jgi:hypothetical protein